ncbi:NUDIX hydrolase [Isoptericola sediminis]|uniref:NUDIX hydrolase n=1 Tax=Isoptericola sediminis TaxID=2733572 RepID=A0A849K4Y2_9MICO|nr:NUDIX hydrolase [Isoptericola sediminis]NNU27099.1 NUDIX hydrolase [Isoptericola sediminis]
MLDPGGDPPVPVGLVRLLLRRSGTVFVVPREGSGKPDLPTSEVLDLGDGRATAERLAATVVGEGGGPTLLGYVRNSVEVPDEQYPWPLPRAHFCVWQSDGEPTCEGSWVSVDDPASPLRTRHWWPLVAATDAGNPGGTSG